MRPTLAPGDRLLVRYAAPVRPGAVVLARFPDGTLAVKRAAERRTTRSGDPAWWLLSDNPAPASTRATAARSATRTCWPSCSPGCGPGHSASGPDAGPGVRMLGRARAVVSAVPDSESPMAARLESLVMVANPEQHPAHPYAGDPVFDLHVAGKMETASTVALTGADELSLAYTPGVARVCEAIAADPSLTQHYTWVPNTVAIVTDGTAVLGLGDIGPAAAMPVMEGKAVLFKQFGGVDAVPICLDTTDVEEIIDTVVRLAPSFGGINLEDISAPRCFEIEDRLKERLSIPVFHDDQHGTAVVALAALKNALLLTGRDPGRTRVVISGAGAAGVAVARILLEAGVRDLAVLDRQGVLNSQRSDLTPVKQALARDTADHFGRTGRLEDVMRRRGRLHRRLRRHRARGGRRARWPTTRSSSGWPTPTPRSTPTSHTGTPGSSPPAARTSPTRSTTCSPSPGSSGVRSTSTPPRSPRA